MKRSKSSVTLLIIILLFAATVIGFYSRAALANYFGKIVRSDHVTVRGLTGPASGNWGRSDGPESGIGAIISEYVYTYDKNGNRKTQTETQNGTEESTDYNYDVADRLENYTANDGTDSVFTEYTYEAYNRKTENVSKNGKPVKSRTYNYDSNTDRLLSVTHTGWVEKIDNTYPDNPKTVTVPVTKTVSYTYDNNGNMLTRSDSSKPVETLTFDYDSRNQLVQSSRGPPGNRTLLGQYDYNAGGMRVRHRYSERGDVDYFYDGNSVIEERNTDGSLLAHYRYTDRLFRLDTSDDTQYYHHDALGSTVNLTGSSGNAEVSYRLDPWGHILSQTGTTVNRHIFTGQEHDENTGLIYFGARLYDPDIARFTTQDAYLGEQGTPSSRHRYIYAYSNPTVYIDLYGNIAWMAGLRDKIKTWSEKTHKFAESLNESESEWRFLEAGILMIFLTMQRNF